MATFEPMTVEKLHTSLTWPLTLLRSISEQVAETEGTLEEWEALLVVLGGFKRSVEAMQEAVVEKIVDAAAPEPELDAELYADGFDFGDSPRPNPYEGYD